jgi:hypothetical protein
MKMSEKIGELSKALAKVQGTISHPSKKHKVKFQQTSYSYASLADVINVSKKSLSENGLSIVQMPENTPDGISISTILMHQSGEWIQSELFFPLKDRKPQSIGSAITYARRYSLSAFLNISSEDDDDGSLAQNTNGSHYDIQAKFSQFGITPDELEKYIAVTRNLLDKKNSELWDKKDITTLRGLYKSFSENNENIASFKQKYRDIEEPSGD